MAGVREEQGLTRHRIVQGMVLLALFGAVLYGNSLKGKLFWDDEETVVQNVFIRSPSYLKEIFLSTYHAGAGKQFNSYRPLATASFLLDYQLWRLQPLGYHLTNVLLHIANAWLVLLIFYRLFGDSAVSFVAAALFLLHPINTEAVNYVSNRTDLLLLFFVLYGFLSYLLYRAQHRIIFLVGCLGCYLGAVFSKEAGLVFPLLCLAYERFFKTAPRKMPIPFYLLCAAIAVGYLFLRADVLRHARLGFLGLGVSSGQEFQHLGLRFLVFAKAWLVYLKLFFFPVGLHMGYDNPTARSVFDAGGWLAGGLFCSFVGLTLWWGRKEKPVAFGMVWFLLGLLPVSGIVPLGNVIGEHYVYLASPGFFLAAAAVWMRLLDGQHFRPIRPVLVGVGLAVAVALGALTVVRNQVWTDPLTFYLDVIRKTERSYKAYSNAGMEYFRRGDTDKAEVYFKQALKIRPADPVVLNNVGLICFKRGDQDGEEVYYRSAIQVRPSYIFARRNLTNLYIRQKKYALAVEQIQKVVEYYPYDRGVYKVVQSLPKEFQAKIRLPSVNQSGQNSGRQP